MLALGAVACLTVCMASCKGRRADATPNGETVEVNIDNVEIYDTETVKDTDTTAAAADVPAVESTDTAAVDTTPV